jgi:hypothetical protein
VNDVTYRSSKGVGFKRRFVECFGASCIASRSKSLVSAVFGDPPTSVPHCVLLCILGSSVQGFAEYSRAFAIDKGLFKYGLDGWRPMQASLS